MRSEIFGSQYGFLRFGRNLYAEFANYDNHDRFEDRKINKLRVLLGESLTDSRRLHHKPLIINNL